MACGLRRDVRPGVRALTAGPSRTSDSAYGVSGLRIISAGFIFYAFGMVLEQAFNGAGDTMTPTLINLGCFWVLELPLAWLLADPLGFGPSGAFFSITVSYGFLAAVSVWLFRRGRWKLRTV